MSILTQNRRSSKSREFTAEFVSIVVRICDHRYSVDRIDAGECGRVAWRLSKHDGDHTVHDVLLTRDGTAECTCADFEFRCKGLHGARCKHIRAMQELGLMPAPAPVTAPAVEPVEIQGDNITLNSEPAPAPCCSAVEPLPCQECIEPPAVDLPGEMVDPDDAESDPELWGDGWDDHCWNVTDLDLDAGEDRAEAAESFAEMEARSFLDASDRLTLSGLIEHQIAFYSGWGNDAGRLLASHMAELALKLAMTGATTPAEFEARAEILEADRHEASYLAGFEDGRAAREPGMTAGGRLA